MGRRKKKEIQEQKFIVMNKYNEVYSGMKNGGEFQWSTDWYEAKPLTYSNTTFIKMTNSKVELVKLEDFY
jgi:hypothetical protein